MSTALTLKPGFWAGKGEHIGIALIVSDTAMLWFQASSFSEVQPRWKEG